MYVVRGVIAPEVATVLMRAIEAASEAMFTATSADDEPLEPEQRRADALSPLAERALAAGFGDVEAPVSGTRAERYQVMLHVEPASLAESGEPGTCDVGGRLPSFS